jgi:hypothetical protein
MRAHNFCGIEMSLADYDDARALRAYVGEHCRHLMTPLERRISDYLVPIVSNSSEEKIRRLNEFMEERDGHVPDEEIIAAYTKPYAENNQIAIERVIAECAHQLNINRCPECRRIARTPKAAQCMWCGYDWH